MYEIHLKQWKEQLERLCEKLAGFVDGLRIRPHSNYFHNLIRETVQEISKHILNKPTMNKELTIAEQLMENHNNGLFTVVQDEDNEYAVFSTLDDAGQLRFSGWCEDKREALKEIGCDGYNDVNRFAKENQWVIIETINPSDYMKECAKKNTKEIKEAIETLKKAGMIVDGKILNLS